MRARPALLCLLAAFSLGNAPAGLSVRVTEGPAGRPTPARITIVDAEGKPAPVVLPAGSKLAARPGVVYTPEGRAEIPLPPGRYTVHAGRGFEYSVATRAVEIKPGASTEAALEIRREVPTAGWVAVDTHVHTFTHSGHGDASIDERAVTLAGEGIELPIATDHDHLTTDQADAARRMGVASYFTPVVGDEVTTTVGHFNAFPFPSGAKPPTNKGADWSAIVAGIRAEPGDRLIVLNHPRDLHAKFRPFDPAHFNAVTGEHKKGRLGVDAIEVINSGAMQTDPTRPIRDWLALLNRGERFVAVGASDSHDVAKHIVGQGRTYVRANDADPGRIDVAAAVANLKAGRASVSLGLSIRLVLDDRFEPGDTFHPAGDAVKVAVEVFGPSWTAVDRIQVFVNGRAALDERFPAEGRGGLKTRLTRSLPKPRHDAHVVAVASGPGVTEPYWPIEHPYQPTGPGYVPRVWAVSNPARIEAEGDGVWTSPLEHAERLVARHGTEPSGLIPALNGYDEAVAAQAAGLCVRAGREIRSEAFATALRAGSAETRTGFEASASTLGK